MENSPYCPPQSVDEGQGHVEEKERDDKGSSSQEANLEEKAQTGDESFRTRTGATAKEEKLSKSLLTVIPESGPTRSLSVSYPAQPVRIRRRGDMRRKSMSMIKKGHTGQTGSKTFQQALERDAQYEIHPGWESLRKIAGTVG